MNEEAHPEAAAILANAGWRPHPKWEVYTRGTLVMGGDLQGGFHVKNWGLDVHGLDTPDTPEEAAAWLVQRFALPEPQPELEPRTYDEATAEYFTEHPEDAPHETHGETGEEADGGREPSPHSVHEGNGAGDAEPGSEPGSARIELAAGEQFDIDALREIQLLDPEQIEPDFGADHLEWEVELADPVSEPDASDQPGAFIFGDNLHQMRTAAIGLVVQIALSKLPQITAADDARLSELRNFTMGVSEGRWANDPAKQSELDELELIASLARQIEAARDTKVGFLVEASREEIEAFDPQADWP